MMMMRVNEETLFAPQLKMTNAPLGSSMLTALARGLCLSDDACDGCKDPCPCCCSLGK